MHRPVVKWHNRGLQNLCWGFDSLRACTISQWLNQLAIVAKKKIFLVKLIVKHQMGVCAQLAVLCMQLIVSINSNGQNVPTKQKNGCNIYKDCNRRPQACQRYRCSQIIRALEGTRDPNSRKRLEELVSSLIQIAYENGETSFNPQV